MAKDEAVPVTGGCPCGAARFEGEAFMRGAYYCDCTICQKCAGKSVEIGVPIKVGVLRFTKGAPTYYRSSNFVKRAFRAVCGSRLLWATTDTKDEWATSAAVCALDNPADVQPHCHTYRDTKLPWLHIPDGLPGFTEPEMPPVVERWKAECS